MRRNKFSRAHFKIFQIIQRENRLFTYSRLRKGFMWMDHPKGTTESKTQTLVLSLLQKGLLPTSNNYIATAE